MSPRISISASMARGGAHMHDPRKRHGPRRSRTHRLPGRQALTFCAGLRGRNGLGFFKQRQSRGQAHHLPRRRRRAGGAECRAQTDIICYFRPGSGARCQQRRQRKIRHDDIGPAGPAGTSSSKGRLSLQGTSRTSTARKSASAPRPRPRTWRRCGSPSRARDHGPADSRPRVPGLAPRPCDPEQVGRHRVLGADDIAGNPCPVMRAPRLVDVGKGHAGPTMANGYVAGG